ncbi:MAG: DUF308 domain-containing protein [Synergistaceae bacterium]|nr:DUF308 domain-containing protein [Synergistaceae bacterium]
MKSLRVNLWVTGGILILLGVLMMRYPIEAIMSAGMILGFGIIATGVNHIAGWYFFRLNRFLVMGFLDIIAGLIMVIQPGISAFFIPFVIGLWFFSEGISRMCAGFWLGGAEVPGWWMLLISGIAMIAFAVLMCISPLSSTFSVMMILSGVLIASGVLAVIEGFVIPQ